MWLLNPEKAGSFALPSIGVSALTTGYTSAMISFDMDVDVKRRNLMPATYGYIPDDNGLRGRCFNLMIMISALNNMSRSVGCALLATRGSSTLVSFVLGEMAIYLLYKIARDDFLYFIRIDNNFIAILVAIIERTLTKVIVDFSGCFHLRLEQELGGFAFAVTMCWNQVFPFVALYLYDDEKLKNELALFLVIVGFGGTSLCGVSSAGGVSPSCGFPSRSSPSASATARQNDAVGSTPP